jgi:uroporphyrinogen decarboxylase
MDSLERVITALEREIPDRVPHFEFEISSSVIEAIVPGGDIFDLTKKLDLDAISPRVDQKRQKIGNDTFRDERGLVVKKTTQDYLEPVNTVINSESDLKKFEFPDPYAPHRLKGLKKAIDLFKGRKAIIAFLRDGWSEVRDLRGYANSLMDFMDNPALIKGILDKAVEYYSELGKIAASLGAEIAFSGDDIAGKNGLLMSPSQFKEFIFPAMKRLYKNWHDCGLYVIKHSDGDLNQIMDLLVETGIDCLHPIDPIANMDLGKVKAEYGSKICIMGNVNCAGNLVHGTQEDVIREVKECIKKAASGGGYILSSSNSIPKSVKPENYVAMVKAVKEFGKYC